MNGGHSFIDIFAGAGGLSLGFCLAGFKPIAGIDIAPNSSNTYERNLIAWGALGLSLDVTQESFLGYLQQFLDSRRVSRLDLVVAGLPMEPFSVAQRRPDPSDPRNRLYRSLVEAVACLRPRGVLVEMIPKFRKADSGAHYQGLVSALINLGYTVDQWTLDAAHFGVPQTRERLYLVAFDRSLVVPSPPLPTNGEGLRPVVTVRDALSDLPDPARGRTGLDTCPLDYAFPPQTTYQEQMRSVPPGVLVSWDGRVDNHIAVPHSPVLIDRFRHIKPGENLGDLFGRPEVPPTVKPAKAYNSRSQRLIGSRPSVAVTTHCMDELLHNAHDRSITPREAARLQSFPDWFTFTGPRSGHHGSLILQDQYEQIGDATPPLLARAIARQLAAVL